MTNVIELAKKCGATAYQCENYFMFSAGDIQAFYAAAQKEQREKDAKICDDFASIEKIGQWCAEEIRNQHNGETK